MRLNKVLSTNKWYLFGYPSKKKKKWYLFGAFLFCFFLHGLFFKFNTSIIILIVFIFDFGEKYI